MKYQIKRSAKEPALKGNWDESAWRPANVVEVRNFLAQSGSYRPKVELKLLWVKRGIYVFFRVHDRYVRCLRTDYQAAVCRDSCVEFFVEPLPGKGYFNFEINCGGAMLLHYLDYRDKKTGRLKVIDNVPERLAKTVHIYHSMPRVVYPEIEFEVTWKIEYFIPFRLFEHYLGPLGPIAGQVWRANFYKCANECSHPHWASWAPLHGVFSFHVPQYFAPIHFAG